MNPYGTVFQVAYVGDADPWFGKCSECKYRTNKRWSPGSAEKSLAEHYNAKHGSKSGE